MTQDMNESTRIMPAGGTPIDRTMVAGSAPMAGAAPVAGATQMGSTVTCPICHTVNSGLETYCGECGFLLSSAPGEAAEPSGDEPAVIEMVEAASGRRFPLRPGENTVGRENADVMLLDGTVSRRHARLDVNGDTVTVTDLGSTNGTHVDGARLAANVPTPVPTGATVRFGNATLTLGDAIAATPAAAEPTIVGAPVSDQTLVGSAPAQLPSIDLDAPAVAPADPAQAPVARLAPANDATREISLASGLTTIGRRTGNTVVISGDAYVSGRHAQVQVDNTGCYVSDLGSTNGTTVNGQRLEPNVPQLLLEGDEIAIGQSSYRFETMEAPEDAPEAAADAATDQPEPDAGTVTEGSVE